MRQSAPGLSLVPSHEPPVPSEVFEALSPLTEHAHGAALVHLTTVGAQHPVLAGAAG
jgi:hypothetical protein